MRVDIGFIHNFERYERVPICLVYSYRCNKPTLKLVVESLKVYIDYISNYNKIPQMLPSYGSKNPLELPFNITDICNLYKLVVSEYKQELTPVMAVRASE